MMAAILVTVLLCLIAVYGIGPAKVGSVHGIKLGLDLAGGVSITYQTVKEEPTVEEMNDTRYKLEKRVQNYSTESAVYQEGTNRINVDIPGVENAEQILAELGNAGAIYFILGENNLTYSADSESGFVLSRSIEEIIAAGEVVIDGTDVKTADAVSWQENGLTRYGVSLVLNEIGTGKFAKATGANVGKVIAIVYDGEVISAPIVNEAITGGEASISGSENYQEANNLAATIRIGALPLELKEMRSNVVGASLGAEAIEKSLLAGAIGLVLVMIFMIVCYRVPGVATSIALCSYVALMVILLDVLEITLTLSGIAGIILSIGMAVDANVIIFTRIKEELTTGKTVRSSIKIGFQKALSAIVDGNVTTLIAALVLYVISTGTVKGFATTLALGIVLSMIMALVITKFILNALYSMGFDDEKYYGLVKERKAFPFVSHGKKYIVISGLLILLGVGAMIAHKASSGEALAYGLDFKGGTSLSVVFPDEVQTEPKELERVVLDTLSMTSAISKVANENKYVIKTQELSGEQRSELLAQLEADYAIDQTLVETENISGTVSGEMKRDAFIAVLIATVCMLIYIWIRFKNFGFAASAVVALVHDVLVVITLYAVARISVGNTFIACMLTLVGYSINATIVIFDRIRENIAEKQEEQTYEDIVNNSITQTLSRSINTSLTTLFMVVALWIFGVESVKEFVLPLIAGVVCGAYSSVCITGTFWCFLRKHLPEKAVEEEE